MWGVVLREAQTVLEIQAFDKTPSKSMALCTMRLFKCL